MPGAALRYRETSTGCSSQGRAENIDDQDDTGAAQLRSLSAGWVSHLRHEVVRPGRLSVALAVCVCVLAPDMVVSSLDESYLHTTTSR